MNQATRKTAKKGHGQIRLTHGFQVLVTPAACPLPPPPPLQTVSTVPRGCVLGPLQGLTQSVCVSLRCGALSSSWLRRPSVSGFSRVMRHERLMDCPTFKYSCLSLLLLRKGGSPTLTGVQEKGMNQAPELGNTQEPESQGS